MGSVRRLRGRLWYRRPLQSTGHWTHGCRRARSRSRHWRAAGIVLASSGRHAGSNTAFWIRSRPGEHLAGGTTKRICRLASRPGTGGSCRRNVWIVSSCRQTGGHHGVFWPLVAARLVSTTLMLTIVAIAPRDPRPLRAVLWPIVLSGLLDSAGNALFIAATRHGRLDVAAVLSSLYPASTVILARVLLKERISVTQGAGIVGALASVALISAR